MFDWLVFGLLLFFAISGFIKGVVSQLASLAGIILAFIFAKPLSPMITNVMSNFLGTSPEISKVLSPILTGLLIYFALVLLGNIFEGRLVNKISLLKGANRLGGAALSFVKGLVILMVLLFFIHLIPSSVIDGWAPKLYESKTYQFSLKRNPLGTQDVIQRFKDYRSKKKESSQTDQEKIDPKEKSKKDVEDVITDYLLEEASNDPKKLLKKMTDSKNK